MSGAHVLSAFACAECNGLNRDCGRAPCRSSATGKNAPESSSYSLGRDLLSCGDYSRLRPRPLAAAKQLHKPLIL
jgi:hypothetical protein